MPDPDFNIIGSPLEPGLSVIEASAGTGKTYTISRLVPKLILDPDSGIDSLEQILLVTFTNDAARELSERVRRALEQLLHHPASDEAEKDPAVHELRGRYQERIQPVISRALLEIDRLNVSTIHSFCQRVLQTEGALCGLPVMPELIANTDELIEEALHDLWEGEIASSPKASALAAGLNWKFQEDLKFQKTFLPHRRATAIPPAVDFQTALLQIDQVANAFTHEVCDELLALVTEVGAAKGWNSSAPPDVSTIEGFIKTLRNATALADLESLSALEELSKAADWVNGTSHKELKQRMREATGVTTAKNALQSTTMLRWHFRISCLGKIRSAVEQTLRRNRQITYDGLIHTLAGALRGPNAHQLIARLRERYRIALIDESQDTDKQQFGIFEKIFLSEGGHRLVLIGDPKQAIYSFRGADVNTYLEAKLRPGTCIHGLTKTFRAPQKLVESTNALFRRPSSLLKENLSLTPASSGKPGDHVLVVDGVRCDTRLEFWNAVDGTDGYSNSNKRTNLIAAQVASEIVRLLDKGTLETLDADGKLFGKAERVHPSHIAVLVRAAYQAKAVEDALKKRKVPAVRAGGDDVLASDEAHDLLSILKALDDPRNKSLRFAALATRMLGKTDADLRALNASEEAMLPEFRRWEEILLTKGAAVALALIDTEQGIVKRLALGDDGDRRVTNFRQLCDIIQRAYAEHGSHPSKLLRWYGGEIASAMDRSDVEERQLQLESDADAVRIITMHKAKGLEFPLVFCPFLGDSTDPKDQEKLSRQGADDQLVDTKLAAEEVMEGQTESERFKKALRERLEQKGVKKGDITDCLKKAVSSSAEAALSRASLEERLRLAYVAITRAQVKVWIHSGASAGRAKASAVDWLLRNEFLTEQDASIDELDFEIWRIKAAEKDRGGRHHEGINLLLQNQSLGTLAEVISFKEPPVPEDTAWTSQAPDHPVQLRHETLSKTIPDPWYLTSFSSLTKEKNPHWEPENRPESANGTTSDPAPSSNPFRDAVGSKEVGTAIHDFLEQWDFQEPDSTFEARVVDHLARYILPKPKESDLPFHEAVTGMLRELRGSILPGFEIALSEACPEPAASEWHFQIPILDERPLSTGALAEIFARHPQQGYEEYHLRLADLGAKELAGFLHGFIDRLALHPKTGEWGVVDWKTNKLPRYDEESLRNCAMENHYFLQTQLYLVALRRHLGKRLDQDSKISGAWLVFLRGARANNTEGILRIAPSKLLLSELDSLFFKP